MKNRPSLRSLFQATGIPGLWGDIRAHSHAARREQEDFQRHMQWIVDNHGLDELKRRQKAERDARRRQRRWPF